MTDHDEPYTARMYAELRAELAEVLVALDEAIWVAHSCRDALAAKLERLQGGKR